MGENKRGGLFPSGKGCLRRLPRYFFFILSASIRVLMGGYMRFGQDFSRFGHDLLLEKIFLAA